MRGSSRAEELPSYLPDLIDLLIIQLFHGKNFKSGLFENV